jgi:glycosyltransferase involved in cell wall biosynthesis
VPLEQYHIHAMALLTIYILCHNRPDYARQAISSILGQTCQAFTLVVSDNSSNDDVERMVTNEFPEIHYIRRFPMLKPLEHFNRCIAEAKSDYFCLFHDDDIMEPGFVESMEKCLHAYPTAIAIGCNAKIEKLGKLKSRACFWSFQKHELIDTPLGLARRYFSRAQSGSAPFPGYVYNRRLVGDQRLQVEGGKYADVIWLMGLARKGSIVWLNKLLMTYRFHGSNDSSTESLRDRLRLLGFLKLNMEIFDADLLQDYRRAFIYKKMLKAHAETHPERRRLAIAFLKNYRWTRYTRLDYYKAVAVRALAKLVATNDLR